MLQVTSISVPPPWSRHLQTDLIFIIYFNNRNVATNKARHGAVCAACVLPLVCGRFGDSSTAALCHAAFGRILNYIKYCGLYNLLITRMSTNINCKMLLIETFLRYLLRHIVSRHKTHQTQSYTHVTINTLKHQWSWIIEF